MAKPRLTEIHDTIKELTEIETELDRSVNTTMWISDPHGAGERFTTILKGRFGLIWRTAQEALSKHFSIEKLDYLDHAIQAERYLTDEPFTMERQDVIWALVKIIRYKVEDIVDFDHIRSSINQDLKAVIENLILGFHVPDLVYENELIGGQGDRGAVEDREAGHPGPARGPGRRVRPGRRAGQDTAHPLQQGDTALRAVRVGQPRHPLDGRGRGQQVAHRRGPAHQRAVRQPGIPGAPGHQARQAQGFRGVPSTPRA